MNEAAIWEFKEKYGTRGPRLVVEKSFDRLGYVDQDIPLIKDALKMMRELEEALEALG
jgi:hypothetical protein